MNRFFLSLCFFCFSFFVATTSKADEQLFELINDRLGLMKAVADYKWNKGLPIENLEREKIVLDQAVDAARRAGVDADSSRRFFQLQIEAAKEIQFYWFDQWEKTQSIKTKNNTSSPDKNMGLVKPVDLNNELRPKLNQIGQHIINRMSETGALEPDHALQQGFYRAIPVAGVSEDTRLKLYKALVNVRPASYASLLEKIRLTAKLRVATTADYAPFSYTGDSAQDETASYQGIDIDLARDLAASLKADIIWIKTSWPGLLADLKAGKFDIAMSGISYNSEREKFGHFSIPYHQGGKTPITRCEDVEKFDTLDEINRKGVRVIVNPGGTNYGFASSRLTKAKVRVFDDNRLIFKEIADNRADVMVTDAIEVKMQSNRIKNLCPSMPKQTLTHLQKAYLMPQDDALREQVNLWLQTAIDSGLVKEVFERHLR